MDGGYESDQCSGVCHGCDEERQDGPEGGKSKCNAEHACIYKPGGDIKTQMLTTELFDFGEREHEAILPDSLAVFGP